MSRAFFQILQMQLGKIDMTPALLKQASTDPEL